LLYGFLLHQRLVIGWQGRKAALWSLMILTLLALLLIFGRMFFPSIHKFV